MLNHKVIELILDLIDNLKRRVMKNRRADASRLSRPHLNSYSRIRSWYRVPNLTAHIKALGFSSVFEKKS